MMNRVAFFLGELCRITEPGKKAVQKLVYLAERKGVDLGMDYCIHYYGPYSSELNQCLHSLEVKDVISINTSGLTHKLKVKQVPKENPFTDDETAVINEIFQTYAKKSPLDLELLTTTDYVATSLLSASERSDEKIKETVEQIKGEKFGESKIMESIAFLRHNGFISP